MSQTHAEGGASRNVHTLTPADKRLGGYIVGIKSDHEQDLPPGGMTTEATRTHRARMLADPRIAQDPSALQGSWMERTGSRAGRTTLDYSQHFTNFSQAFTVARSEKQDALYSPRRGDIGVLKYQPGDAARPTVQLGDRYAQTTVKPGGRRGAPAPVTSSMVAPSFGMRAR